MIARKKYDVFKKSDGLHLLYPELAFVIRGIFIENTKITIDELFRFVVYFYNRNCNELQEHKDVTKAREASLLKFKIPRSVYESKTFIDNENEMALRFMLFDCDNQFNVFISLSFQLSHLLASVRVRDTTSGWSDKFQSIKSSSELMEQSEKIDVMRQKLFGDMKHIEQYGIQKELDNVFKAETAMM